MRQAEQQHGRETTPLSRRGGGSELAGTTQPGRTGTALSGCGAESVLGPAPGMLQPLPWLFPSRRPPNGSQGEAATPPHLSSPVKASPLSPESAKQWVFFFFKRCCSQDEDGQAVPGGVGLPGVRAQKVGSQNISGVKSGRLMCVSPRWETRAEGAERTHLIQDLGSQSCSLASPCPHCPPTPPPTLPNPASAAAPCESRHGCPPTPPPRAPGLPPAPLPPRRASPAAPVSRRDPAPPRWRRRPEAAEGCGAAGAASKARFYRSEAPALFAAAGRAAGPPGQRGRCRAKGPPCSRCRRGPKRRCPPPTVL